MFQQRNRLYILLFLLCMAGYVWLFYSFNQMDSAGNLPTMCLIKQVTNIPCPSCGATRSVISLFQGDFYQALWLNPFGLLITLIMIVVPFWIAVDLILKKSTLLGCYRKVEDRIKMKIIAIPSILLVLLNWVWNIYKGL